MCPWSLSDTGAMLLASLLIVPRGTPDRYTVEIDQMSASSLRLSGPNEPSRSHSKAATYCSAQMNADPVMVTTSAGDTAESLGGFPVNVQGSGSRCGTQCHSMTDETSKHHRREPDLHSNPATNHQTRPHSRLVAQR